MIAVVAALVAILGVVALVATRPAALPPGQVTATYASWTADESSRSTAVARQMLDAAVLPQGAMVVDHKVGGLPVQPSLEGSGIGAYDASRDFVVGRPPAEVLRQLLDELPSASVQTSDETTIGGAPILNFVQDTLPTRGSHLLAATLVYTIARDGRGRSALRVDAQATWAPSRTAAALVPADDTVTVSRIFGGDGSIVAATPPESAAIIDALNALPAGTGTYCHGGGTMFTLSIQPSGSCFPTWTAAASCGSEVDLGVDGLLLLRLGDADCALLHAVDAALPPGSSITGVGDVRIGCAP